MEDAKSFWNQRYINHETGWDIGYPSTPLKEFIDQLPNKSIRILIPGCGNAWEGEYLWNQGFRHVYLIDIAPLAVEGFKKRVPQFPEEQVILGDFFSHEGAYDLILEQTFFCAILPEWRERYVKEMHRLLKPGGMLVGLLFDAPMNADHPPFGGSREEYHRRFSPFFNILEMETAQNSIKPREGREVFIKMEKKQGF
jgi:SAM-dependent methyltransferase